MATMLEALMALDDGALMELFRLRPDLATPPPAGFAQLAERASQSGSLQAAYAGLDQFSGVVLQACCVIEDGAAPDAVIALLGGPGRCPPVALDAALGRLAARAMLRRGEDGAIHPTPGLRDAFSYPLGLGRPLAELVTRSQLTVTHLEKALVRLGQPPKQPGERKSDLVARAGAALADPVLVTGMVAGAPAAARELAQRLASGRPTAPFQRFSYGRASSSPSDWLSERLLLVSFDWSDAEMPREAGLALRGGEAGLAEIVCTRPAVVSSTPDPAMVAAAAQAGAAESVRVTEALLEAWGATPPAMLKAGGIGVRDLKRAAAACGCGEAQVGVYAEVAAAAGLLRPAGERFLPTADYDAWRNGEPAQRWLRLVTGWLTVGRLPSLAGERDLDDKPIAALNPKYALRSVVDVRAAVLAALAGDPRWAPEPKSLAVALVWDGPGRWASFPLDPPTAVDMVLREAALLGVTGEGALSPWGVELVAGRHSAALAAAAVLGRSETLVTFQADLTAVASGPVNADLGAELALLAEVESRGAATVWRFSDQSISRAFDAGRTTDTILAFLAAHSRKDVPQTLAYLVGDVARRHGQIRAATVASYVRSDDAAVIAELCAAKKLRRAGLRPVAPTVAVATLDAAALVVALRGAGYLAVEEDDGGATVVRAPGRKRAAALERIPTRVELAARRRRSGPAAPPAVAPSPDDVAFWVATGPPGRPVEALDGPALIRALRAAGRGPESPGRRDPRTGRIVGRAVPGRPGDPSRDFRRPGSPFGADGDYGSGPFADPDDPDLDHGSLDGDYLDDDDAGFNPECDCPGCVEAAAALLGGADVGGGGLQLGDPALLAELGVMLGASTDDAAEQLALLDGATRDGRPLLIAYEHPRTGPATDIFRVITVTGTTAHLRDGAGRERLVDVDWIEAILETTGGRNRASRRRGRR